MPTITITKRELAEAMRPIARIASSKPTLPFIEYVRLKAELGATTAVLRAQDLDQSLECHVNLAAPADADIDIAVACSELKNLIKGVGELTFEIGADTMKVQGDSESCINLPLYPIAEMPDQPVIPKGATHVLLPTNFAVFLAHAALSASTDPTRSLLGGVNISEIGVTATSGQDLYHIALPLHQMPKDIVLNYTTALANLKQRWQSLAIWTTPEKSTFVAIRGETFLYITKSIEGIYPNWQQVVPEDDSFDLVVSWSEQNAAVLQRFLKGVDVKQGEYVEFMVSQGEIKVCDAVGRSITLAAETEGSNLPCKTPVKASFLLKLITIGHRTLRINTRENVPLKAEGGPGFYVFMPAIREHSSQNEADAVNEAKSQNATPSHDPNEEAKSTPAQQEKGERKTAENAPRDVSPTTEKIHEPEQPSKEKTTMQQTDNTVTKFVPPTPTTNETSDETNTDISAIEEASQCIKLLRGQVKELDSQLAQASRKLAEALLAQRQKKRRYTNAVRTLERIRQASGF